MSSAMPWGRLYYEWAHDLKIQTLPEAFQRRHAMLLCMHIEGLLNPADEDIAFYMRITLEQWLETKAALLAKGLLDESNHLVNWERRQFKSDSSTARSRNHRATLQQRRSDVAATPPDTEADTEADSDTDTEAEEGPPPPPGGEGGTATIGEVLEIYASVLPMLPPVQVVGPMMSHNFKLSLEKFPERRKPEFWRTLFTKARASPFLTGKRKGRDGRPFKCRLDWLLKTDNIADILNGKYPPDQGEERNPPDAKNYGTQIRPLGSKGPAEKR